VAKGRAGEIEQGLSEYAPPKKAQLSGKREKNGSWARITAHACRSGKGSRGNSVAVGSKGNRSPEGGDAERKQKDTSSHRGREHLAR